MSEVFFDELEIATPDYNLEIGSATQGAQTARMLESIEQVLLKEQPEWVMVYGDTNSTIAGALAAVKLHIPVAHVEAGLRSFNRAMSEEWNRVLTDHASDLLFAPTEVAVANLHREGIDAHRIRHVGDVMYDAALFYAEKALKRSNVLSQLGLIPRNYVLATVHRAENTDNPARLHAIFSALQELTADMSVVVPLHPRTRKMLPEQPTCLKMIPPVGYLDMIALEKNAAMVATDSGGVQKEAYFFEVPCVTLRDETEWIELVEMGWNRLAPPVSSDSVLRVVREALQNPRGRAGNPYGNGRTAQAIAEHLRQTQ
jgi:UDP-GlcNAc3NAcA epimerase